MTAPLLIENAADIGLFLLDASLKATLLLGALALADRCFGRRQAAWRSLLWSMGVVGLMLIPLASAVLPTLRIPIPAALAAAPLIETVVQFEQPQTPFAEEFAAKVFRPSQTFPVPAHSISDIERLAAGHPLATPAAASQPLSILPDFDAKEWALLTGLALYLSGVLFFLGRLITGLFYVSALRHQARDIDDPALLKTLQHFANLLGLRRPVKLAASEHISGPTQVGCLAPMIVVPPALLHRRDHRDFAPIIAHELAHVYRWDYLFNLLMGLVQALYWFNPLAWLAVHRLRATTEQACDDWTVELTGNCDRYARTLIDVAEGMRQGQVVALGANMAHRPHIVQRIDRIIALSGRVAPRIGRLASAALIFSLASIATLLGTSSLDATHQEMPIDEREATAPPLHAGEQMTTAQSEARAGSEIEQAATDGQTASSDDPPKFIDQSPLDKTSAESETEQAATDVESANSNDFQNLIESLSEKERQKVEHARSYFESLTEEDRDKLENRRRLIQSLQPAAIVSKSDTYKDLIQRELENPGTLDKEEINTAWESLYKAALLYPNSSYKEYAMTRATFALYHDSDPPPTMGT